MVDGRDLLSPHREFPFRPRQVAGTGQGIGPLVSLFSHYLALDLVHLLFSKLISVIQRDHCHVIFDV